MSEWQPIETAPRDGSEFLAYDSRTKRQDVCHMRNFSLSDVKNWVCQPSQFDGEYGPDNNDFGYEWGDITHWMPLPPPPKDAQA